MLGVFYVETRLAVMSIIVENGEMVERLNALLHEYGEFIIGRMGIPYRKRGVSVIAIALDAPRIPLPPCPAKSEVWSASASRPLTPA